MKILGIPVRRVLRAYAISIALWLPISLLVTWQMYRFEKPFIPSLPLSAMLAVQLARHFSAALLTPPLFYIVDRWPVTGAPWRRSAAYLLGSMPFAFAFAAIRLAIVPYYNEQVAAWEPRSLHALLSLIVDTFGEVFVMYYIGIVVAAHAYAYFVRGQRQEIERLSLRQALVQSELQALRGQLHPHFLFNTLQGISTLIDTDRATAQSMLHTLAELLRKVLKYGSSDLIPFHEELAFARAYLQLEQMRLGRRLVVRWKVSPEVESAQIPQLLLQPLVENAILHGIAQSAQSGWIEIEARLQREQLIVTIRNSIGGASASGLGVGIPNTRARLRFLYGADASFEFTTPDGRVAVAELVLPAFTAPLAEVVNA
jgi:two-component system, LytTR family, sensor kinase